MKPLIDLLHLLICPHTHITDMMQIVERKDGYCYYYLENDIADGDSMPDHLKWKEVVEQYKASLGFSSDKEALEFVRKCITISQDIQKLCGSNGRKLGFVKSIIF